MSFSEFVVIHNGIITNYKELKKYLVRHHLIRKYSSWRKRTSYAKGLIVIAICSIDYDTVIVDVDGFGSQFVTSLKQIKENIYMYVLRY